MHSRLSRAEKRYLERARVCRVASVDARGVTHVAPLCHAFEDWDRLSGIVAHARARFVRRGAELERAVRLLKRKFKQYRDTDIEEVIALRFEAAASWGL